MKNKKLNLLFVIFMCLFMSFGIEEVYAEQDGYCTYVGDGNATAKFRTDGTYDSSIDIKGDDIWNVGAFNYSLSNSIFVYDEDKKIYYCPSIVFIDTGEEGILYKIGFFSRTRDEKDYKFELASASNNVISYEVNLYTNEYGFNTFDPCVISDVDYTTEIKNIENEFNDLKKLPSKPLDKISSLNKQLENVTNALDSQNICPPSNMNIIMKKNNDGGEEDQGSSIAEEIGKWLNDAREETKALLEQATSPDEKEKFINIIDELGKEIDANEKSQSIIQTMASQFKINTTNDVFDCGDLISEELKAVIQYVLNIIRIGAPIILIVLGTLDFGQAVMSNDQEAIKKATSKVVKRGIAIIGLFLVPTMISISLTWIEDLYDKSNKMNCEEVYNDINNG